ncbi:MAG: AmmeMemoRadiSam system protein A [Bacillota bacterium]
MSAGVVLGALVPHPPIMVPEVGGPEIVKVELTCRGMDDLARRVCQAGPETTILITPHGVRSPQARAVVLTGPLAGDLAEFGAQEVRVQFDNDAGFLSTLAEQARAAALPVQEYPARRLDHGATVPLYYLHKAGMRSRLVVMTMPWREAPDLFRYGQVLARTARKTGRRVAVVASGDLSHRLKPGAPAGYHRRGAEFDQLVTRALAAGSLESLLHVDPDLVEDAGQCGLGPLQVLAGALDGLDYRPELLSYEGPFGVGYAVAVFTPAHPLVALARRAIEAYIREGRVLDDSGDPLAGTHSPAGVFVSLKQQGELRGCIGTVQPARASLAMEVIHNAISAATDDPRFPPVSEAELDDLEVSVDVLAPAEPVDDLSELNPREYGVIVRKGQRAGLLLPDLEGVDTAAEQVSIACLKAGLAPGDKGVKLYRFRVERYR